MVVKVEAIFFPNGQIEPKAFWWESGRRYEIDQVVDVCRAASLKAGGIGVRYTCMRFEDIKLFCFLKKVAGLWKGKKIGISIGHLICRKKVRSRHYSFGLKIIGECLGINTLRKYRGS